jgi:hypothetical protein
MAREVFEIFTTYDNAVCNRKSTNTRSPSSIYQNVECSDVLSLLYHVHCCHNIKTLEKVNNERASEYDFSIAIPFSVVTISSP